MSSLLHLMGNQFRVRHHQTGTKQLNLRGIWPNRIWSHACHACINLGGYPCPTCVCFQNTHEHLGSGSKAYIKITSQLWKSAQRFCICLKSPTTYLDLSCWTKILNPPLKPAILHTVKGFSKIILWFHFHTESLVWQTWDHGVMQFVWAGTSSSQLAESKST